MAHCIQAYPTRRRAVALLALLLLAHVRAPAEVQAAQQAQTWLYFSDQPGERMPTSQIIAVRPNIAQKVFVYVRNPTEAPRDIVVQVWAGGKPLPQAAQGFPIKAGEIIQVFFGTPPAPGAKPVPLALVDLPEAASLEVRIFEKDRPDVPLQAVPLRLQRPVDFVAVRSCTYLPDLKTLQMTLQARPASATGIGFVGPPARAELVLDPNYIPDLAPRQKAYGTRVATLSRVGQEATLTAERLEFLTTGVVPPGLILATVDGYERAFMFSSDFPRGGETPSQPREVIGPVVALKAPRILTPDKPLLVELESDNLGNNRVELALGRGLGEDFVVENDQKVIPTTARQERIKLAANSPDGALVIQPEVKDWSFSYDMAGVVGVRTLRVRLVDRDGKQATVPDGALTRPQTFFDALTHRQVDAIYHTLVLDGSPPETLLFVDFPEKLLRGALLPVKAEVKDEDSGIEAVAFYLGSPGPDGKAPPTAKLEPGTLVDPEKGIWLAQLPAPTDTKGKMDVTVQATNTAGLTSTKVVTIQLVDPPPVGAKNGAPEPPPLASIAGMVLEGDRPQAGIIVLLADDKGNPKDTATTNEKGEYLFTKVEPGVYTVSGAKAASRTRGETVVGVRPGDKKIGIDIELFRVP